MKINSSIPSPASLPKARAQVASSQARQAAAGNATAPDDSAEVVHVQPGSMLQSAAAPFDSRRVAEIRDAIASGQLQIDAEKIADRLLDGVRDLLTKDRAGG